MQIHTYCRGCRTPLPINGLGRQDVTCPSCGTSFLFGEGSLYLAPPPGVPADSDFAYQVRMKDGQVLRLHPEMPPLPEPAAEAAPAPGQGDDVFGTLFGAMAAPGGAASVQGGQGAQGAPERLALSQKREAIAALVMPLVAAAEAQGTPMDDDQYFKLALTAAHDLFEAEQAGRLSEFLAEFDVTVPPAQPEVPMPEGGAEIDVSNVYDPDWSPLVLEARRNAMRNITMRSRAGEPITTAKVKVEMALQQMLLEFAEPAPGVVHAPAPAPATASRRPAAAQPVAPATGGGAAGDRSAGWLFFAVGFLFAAASFPLSYFATRANELFGIVVLLALLGIGVRYLYQGLRQALATGPVVTAILVAVVLNPAVGAGLVGCSALGINPFGETGDATPINPGAAPAATNASDA